jgi:hypothetical protein
MTMYKIAFLLIAVAISTDAQAQSSMGGSSYFGPIGSSLGNTYPPSGVSSCQWSIAGGGCKAQPTARLQPTKVRNKALKR